MGDLDMWSLLVGVLLPPVVAAVNRGRWPSWARGATVVASSLAAGAVTVWLSGQLTGGTWLHSTLVVAVAAVASWRGFWKPTGIGPAIEQATDPDKETRP